MFNLILGGAGFIGSNLSNDLMAKNRNVVTVDDLSVGKKNYLNTNAQSELIVGSLLEVSTWESIKKIIGSEEVVVWHLAANSDIQQGSLSPNLDLEKTLGTTIALLSNLSELNVSGVVFASSSAVYGSSNFNPNEESIKDPISYYGATKLASENLLKLYCENNNIPLWIFRFANIVGTPATHGVIYDFCKKIMANNIKLEVLGDGSQQKAYLHIKDLLKVMDLLTVQNLNGGVWNLAPMDLGITVREIAEIVCRIANPNAQIKYGTTPNGWPGDIGQIVLNPSKLQNEVGIEVLSSTDAVGLAIKEIWEQLSS